MGGYSEVHGCDSSKTEEKCSDLIREGKVFAENKTKVASVVGCTVVAREQSCILESCCLSPIRRNSVLEKLRVRRLAVTDS